MHDAGRLAPRIACCGLACVSTAVLLAVTGWRSAALALVAAGAIVAVRARYTAALGTGLLVVVAALAVLTGPAERHDSHPASRHAAQ